MVAETSILDVGAFGHMWEAWMASAATKAVFAPGVLVLLAFILVA